MKVTRAQTGIFAAAAALALVLIFSFRRVPQATRQPAPAGGSVVGPEGAGHPTTVLSGFDYAQTSAGKPKFQVHADRTVGFAQGAGLPSTWYGLESVTLTLFGEGGEPFEVRSDRADYDPRTKAMHLKGNVVMTETSGTEVRTASVDYDPARDTLHVPGAVEMRRGGILGHAASADYRAASKELQLAGPVTAEGTAEPAAPGKAAPPFSTLRSDRAVYRRVPGEIELVGHVGGTRGADRFSSDSMRLHLTAANRIDRADAEGAVTGSVAGEPGQPPQLFLADRAALEFAPSGELERTRLTGAPARIQADAASPEAGSRRVEAPLLILDYEAGQLSRASAEGGARLDRDGLGPAGEPVHETIRSESAETSFSKGVVRKATFSEDVVATTPDGIAKAPAATFAAAENRMTFLASGNRDAEVSAPRGRVVARRIDMFSGASRLLASGSARAFLKPSSGDGRLPGFLSSSKKPTRAKADSIEFDDAAKTATFRGSAAIWQDENALFGDSIRLFDRDRTATADRNVRAVSRSAGPESGGKPPAPTTITSDAMKYEETGRLARFENHVVAHRGPQVAFGDSAESHFNAQNQIERTVLSGRVSFSDAATGRRGAGDRAEDEPLTGITTLFGEPAVAHDALGNRIAGAVLTFRKDSGSVEATAKDGQKIESTYQTKSPSHGRTRGQMH